MQHLNVEVKAHCNDLDQVRDILKSRQARFRGLDRQMDTYFKARRGKLKLREGKIENYLISYIRGTQSSPKTSRVILYKNHPGSSLKQTLASALNKVMVVEKKREIYFIGNVKFHLDSVKGLGKFVEIEAIDRDGSIGQRKLREQCTDYMDLLHIRAGDLVSGSYCDLLRGKREARALGRRHFR